MTETKVLLVLRQSPHGLGRRALRQALGIRNATLSQALRALIARGQVIPKAMVDTARDHKRRGLVIYRLDSGTPRLSRGRCQPDSHEEHQAFVPGPRSVLRYPGGKSKMIMHIAPLLAPALADAKVFSEPFVGGGSVTLWVAENYPRVRLVINDADPLVAALWRVIVSDEYKALAEMVRRRRPTLKFFKERHRGEPNVDLPAAFHCLMINRLSHGGRLDAGFSPDHCARFDGAEFSRRIKHAHRLLAGRTDVYCTDAVALISKLPAKATVYADPPYPTAGPKLYRHGDVDQKALAHALIEHGGPWLVSNESSRGIMELYSGCEIRTVTNSDGGKSELLILSEGLPR